MSQFSERSMEVFRRKGYLVASVEKRKRFPVKGARPCMYCHGMQMIDIASDLWGVFDALAIRPDYHLGEQVGCDLVFIQTTGASNHATRRNKILASAEAKLCLLAGARIIVQSWRKAKGRYEARDEWLTVDQFALSLPETMAEYYKDAERVRLLARKQKAPSLPPGASLPLSPYLSDEEVPF